MFINCNHKNLLYMGRNDFSESSVRFIYAGASVKIKFTGTKISARIKNRELMGNKMSIGAVVDGKVIKLPFTERDVEFSLLIADNLEDTEHSVVLYKRQDASHYYEFYGFELDNGATILDCGELPYRKMECYGDSVSSGQVVEALEYVGANDPENHLGDFDNSWYSYSMITARNLGAQLNNNTQGGISIFDNTGYYHAPNFIGIETTYNKLSYYPEGPYSDWDFSEYTPHVVLFAVGQNDPHNEGHEDNDITDTDFRNKWKGRYKEIASDLRCKYPKATFIFMLTVLCHDEEWDKALAEVVAELCDEKMHYLKLTRCGKATPGHPRIPEQYEMAEELTAYITSLGDSIWQGWS